MASNENPTVPIQKTPTDNPNEAPPMTTPDQSQQKVLTKEDVSPSPQRPEMASNENPTVPIQKTPTDNPNEAPPMTTPDQSQQKVLTKEDVSPSPQRPEMASNENPTVPIQKTPTDNPNEAPPMTTPDQSQQKVLTKEDVSPSQQRQATDSNEQSSVLSERKDFQSIEQSSEEVQTQTRVIDDPNNDTTNSLDPTLRSISIERELSSHKRHLSTRNSSVFKKPQCLICASEDNTLAVNYDVLDEISRIDKPCVVVAIAGLYRTGKSFLMNRIANEQTGFALGDTIESTTKGIWVWCKDHPEQKGTVLILLDTEGLGDIEKGDSNHDNGIFTLATLLCSTLVYNMKGQLDQDPLNKLTFVSEMSKNIKFGGRCDEDNSLLQCVLPGFVLALRDFEVKLIKDGRTITEDEYLEQGLESRTGKGASFNKLRESIRKFFPKGRRRCFAFPRPADTLENIESLTFQDLSQNFQKVTTKFLAYIYCQEPKQLEVSKSVNGSMFATLTRNYVNALAKGAVPNVDDAFTMVAKIENQRVKKECMNMFRSKIKELQLPQPSKMLNNHFQNIQWSALEYMRTNAIKDLANVVERNAEMEMDSFWQQTQRKNDEELETRCEKILSGLESIRNLFVRLQTEEYNVLGGHRKFKRDVETARQQYEQALSDYEPREVGLVWSNFANELRSKENKILEKDEELSVEEKKREKKENAESMERIKAEMAEDNQKALEKQKKELDQQQRKLNVERERRDKEHEDKVEDLQKKIASLETNKETEKKLLDQIAELHTESRRQREKASNEIKEMQQSENKKLLRKNYQPKKMH